MINNKTKYIIFPERTYVMEFEDFDGKPFKVDVQGEEIIAALRRGYALEKVIREDPIFRQMDK
jgi:hypothetical protein